MLKTMNYNTIIVDSLDVCPFTLLGWGWGCVSLYLVDGLPMYVPIPYWGFGHVYPYTLLEVWTWMSLYLVGFWTCVSLYLVGGMDVCIPIHWWRSGHDIVFLHLVGSLDMCVLLPCWSVGNLDLSASIPCCGSRHIIPWLISLVHEILIDYADSTLHHYYDTLHPPAQKLYFAL